MDISHSKIRCSDGYKLSVSVFRPLKIKAAVMIAPATGIKRGFYHPFADFLASKGYGVVCFDYRGIGDSLEGAIAGSKASLVDWGQLDMSGVLKALQDFFPETSYHLIGHSAGGQLIGLMSNARELSSIFNFASSSGSLSNMRFLFYLKAAFFLNVFVPLSNIFFGYSKSKLLGMGEALPKCVGMQWRRWCNGKGYAEVDFERTIQTHLYSQITAPSLWIYSTDDEIANLRNVEDMIRVYSRMKSSIVSLDPGLFGYQHLGHIGFFRSEYHKLWSYAVDWLDLHSTE